MRRRVSEIVVLYTSQVPGGKIPFHTLVSFFYKCNVLTPVGIFLYNLSFFQVMDN